MPHRVTNFFRSSSDGISNVKAARRRSPDAAGRTFSYASSLEDDTPSPTTDMQSAPSSALAVKPPKSGKDKDKDGHHHRISIPGLHLGGSRASKEKELAQQHPSASLDWKIESPPAVMHGDAENSTGALISGQLLLAVKEAPFEVDGFDARLDIHITQKKPFSHHCHECANQKTEIKTWNFLGESSSLSKRTHEFPFSVLLEGHLPATTDNSLVSVRYEFTAEVRPRTGPTLKLAKTIEVKRSLPVPELPHHSVRIFPPTNIAASVHYPQVIHPIGTNKLDLRLEGIAKANPDAKTIEIWKLKRLSWKLEETLTTVAPACEKHAPKAAAAAGEQATDAQKKGVKRTETRTIGNADLSSGWKADYTDGGNIEAELTYACNDGARASCDLKSQDGTHITHQLVVEMVVVQEWAPSAQPKHLTPTGVARILRMHFSHIVTERAGLGVSWDNEAPPIYQDVPPSPPAYFCDVPYESVEDLTLTGGRPSVESAASRS